VVRPENITIDCRLWLTSGIGKYLQNVIPVFVGRFEDINFTLLGDKSVLNGLDWPHNVVDIIEFTSPIYSIEEQILALQAIPKKCNLLWWPHWNIPLLFRGQIVTTIYDAFHLRIPKTPRNILKNLYTNIMFSGISRKSLMTLTLSEFSKKELSSLSSIKMEAIHITNLAVDHEWFDFIPLQRKIDKPYIVYVGNVKPHKNLRTLVKAFIEIIEDIPHTLVIIGKKEGFITGDKEVQKLAHLFPGRIEFTGWVDDIEVKNYVANADLMVFPTLYEGFGIPPLEAMACSCPVLASNIPVVREVCGDAAIYFDPNNVQALSNLMSTVLDDEQQRRDIILKGLERARYYKWDVCIDKTIDEFSKLFNSTKNQ
jgi:glycosyltransferase involved in cell wall biosynthesis